MSTVAGYNVYRGTVSGGPYTKINSSLVAALDYIDSTVQSGTTYFYVTTAIDSTVTRACTRMRCPLQYHESELG